MNRSFKKHLISQDGAALVTVILVSLLLGTACIALLTAVSAGSRNNTDALSEYKAYYAAESGLQATVNVLRYRVEGDGSPVTYSEATGNPNMSSWLGTGPIAVGSESSYSIIVTDPDDSAGQTTFSTQGTFEQAIAGSYASTRVYGTAPNTLTVSFNPISSVTVAPGTITSFGSFRIVKSGSGATSLPSALKFRIDYVMANPREGNRTIRGTIATNGIVSFQTDTAGAQPIYGLMGGTLKVCNSNVACTAAPTNIVLPAATTTPQDSPTMYGSMSALEPYRLRVLATGYYSPDGPNGAKQSKKQLEAIIQRNFFNDLSSTGAISMLGPNAYFRVGASSQMDIDGGAYPSVTVSDQAGLDTVNGNHTNGDMLPPPEIQSNDVPDWQQSASAMDALVQQLRQSAQDSGRYFNGTNPASFGNFSSGTGITFCEGSCSMSGNTSGGGILVVTGTFSTSGNPTFNGLVLAIGRYVSSANPGGVVRSGGGNEVFTGNIVIAPYNPSNLVAGFEQPRYDQNGGPGDTINSEVSLDQAFDGTASITDFILGIAEK